jgi:prevent-host-death family protein
MITVGVGQLKPNFSDILNDVRAGEEILISYGRKKEKVAVIVPYNKYCKRNLKKTGHSASISDSNDENHELDSFIGSWVEDSEFDKAMQTFSEIDQELWQ